MTRTDAGLTHSLSLMKYNLVDNGLTPQVRRTGTEAFKAERLSECGRHQRVLLSHIPVWSHIVTHTYKMRIDVAREAVNYFGNSYLSISNLVTLDQLYCHKLKRVSRHHSPNIT